MFQYLKIAPLVLAAIAVVLSIESRSEETHIESHLLQMPYVTEQDRGFAEMVCSIADKIFPDTERDKIAPLFVIDEHPWFWFTSVYQCGSDDGWQIFLTAEKHSTYLAVHLQCLEGGDYKSLHDRNICWGKSPGASTTCHSANQLPPAVMVYTGHDPEAESVGFFESTVKELTTRLLIHEYIGHCGPELLGRGGLAKRFHSYLSRHVTGKDLQAHHLWGAFHDLVFGSEASAYGKQGNERRRKFSNMTLAEIVSSTDPHATTVEIVLEDLEVGVLREYAARLLESAGTHPVRTPECQVEGLELGKNNSVSALYDVFACYVTRIIGEEEAQARWKTWLVQNGA